MSSNAESLAGLQQEFGISAGGSGLPAGLTVSGTGFEVRVEQWAYDRLQALSSPSLPGSLVKLNQAVLAGLDSLTPPLSFVFPISAASFEGRVVAFRQSLAARMVREQQEFVIEIDDLDLFAYGETFSDAMEDLFGQLAALSRRFAPLGPSEITPGGAALKAKLQKYGLAGGGVGSD
ncbi:MAG: hypothetical protein L3K00_08035 [Thermoplasmata archaeon]|nr:hypothetical protein [Thermoplasmata archaeon]